MKFFPRLFPYGSVPILMYHQIATTTPEEDPLRLAVPPERFEAQMRYLHERRTETITLNDVRDAIENDSNVDRNCVVITFDDGYFDNYTNGFPILRKYAFSATIFLVSDFVGKRTSWGTGGQKLLMDWSHIREMSKSGICFQSHTCTHPDLTVLTDESVVRELLGSQKTIEDALGVPVCHLTYPYGRYNERIMQLAKDTGYVAAYTDHFSHGGKFCQARVACFAFDSSWEFRLKTSYWGSWFLRIRSLPKRSMAYVIRTIHGASK